MVSVLQVSNSRSNSFHGYRQIARRIPKEVTYICRNVYIYICMYVSFVTCCCRIHLRLFPVRGKHIHYVPFDSWLKANFSEIGEKSRVPP